MMLSDSRKCLKVVGYLHVVPAGNLLRPLRSLWNVKKSLRQYLGLVSTRSGELFQYKKKRV